MKISEEIKKAIAECSPGIVATAARTGKPNVSAKGSLQVLDDEHLIFADIHSPRTIENLKANPQVAIYCLSPSTRKGCRIWGKADIINSGDLFDKFVKEFSSRKMKVNHMVKIFVEEAETF
jgi:predicted pyridoxine 5'-phosphate oxidase superfamily flavin-nucleotide-binding protein